MDVKALNRELFESNNWLRRTYRGIQILKYDTDLELYIKNIRDTKPDLIIECGTLKGASAQFFSDLGVQVLTLDIVKQHEQEFEGITYWTVDSTDPDTVNRVKDFARGYKRVMVVLDSDHSKDHVLRELELYSPLVTKGCYLVIEDTFLGDYMLQDNTPAHARDEFLKNNDGYAIQPMDIVFTMNPSGWLLKR